MENLERQKTCSGVALALGLTLTLVALPGSPVQATTYWVDIDTCPGAGSGTPGDPFCSIQSGIDAASAGDTVQVAAGTYVERIAMKSGVVIQGAGQGVSIIDGDALGSVVTAVDVDSAATLDGFTITNGGNTFAGGGMYNEDSSPTVSNCTFSANSATFSSFGTGGGMHNLRSSPTVTGCTFSGNDAHLDGGGMYNEASSPVLTDCTFSDNTVANGRGGAIFNESSSLTLTRCTFSGNSASDLAGAMYNSSSTAEVVDSTFFENEANVVGGVYNVGAGSTLTFVNCVFNRNDVQISEYGLDISNYASLTVTNCSFWPIGDGTIYNASSTAPTVTNCIFRGGLVTTIINVPATSQAVVTYSNFCDYAGTGNICADPKFVDGTSGNLRLRPFSPCIDAGDNSAPALPATDIDGAERRIDDPTVTDTGYGTPPIVDMGAYEFDPSGFVFVDGFESGDCTAWSSTIGEAP